ncbi:MAG TPA: adenylosuccinate lyase [Candidatus Saccharimonadales bacterium]|nr:adenylosuccinate lyase [Candidatus Saccharimonadales bacterium]
MSDLEYKGEAQPPVNVLASRYASPEMVANFSDEAKVFMERGLWIEIMRQQAALGLDIPEEAIQDYEEAQGVIDLESIREREKKSRHDVNSRIEEFNDLAGHQYIQWGMTSRDLTENAEQYQILRAMDIINVRVLATLGRMAARAAEYNELPMAGRTHNVAAQTITLGKRFANFGEELLDGYDRLVALRAAYALRGIKGPVGTQQDMLDLFEGDESKLAELEHNIAEALGFQDTLGSVGQVYPRSMDFDVVTALKQATAGPVNFATTLRLMAGQELATEGFKPGQVGSNAMPHKMNAARAERITSLSVVLSGAVTMASEISSRQWNEGDVSCSAARRVFIPDAFYASDGIFQTTMEVLDNFGAYPEVINAELQRYLPFLTTTKALMAAVKGGVGREEAHAIIKEHAVAVALSMRETGQAENDLFERLANDERLPITKEDLEEAVGEPIELTGAARSQTSDFVHKVSTVLREHPDAAAYTPATVL